MDSILGESVNVGWGIEVAVGNSAVCVLGMVESGVEMLGFTEVHAENNRMKIRGIEVVCLKYLSPKVELLFMTCLFSR